MIDIVIRQEEEKDYELVKELTYNAFKNEVHTDGDEHNLIGRLRNSDNFVKELSLVALKDKEIIGHIMATRLDIKGVNKTHVSLAIAPLSVDPHYQKMGVGSKLIKEIFEIAKKLGYESAFVLGSEVYYPKFGFKESLDFDLKSPFDVPSENFMAIELKPNSLENVDGDIIFAKEFF